MPLPGQTLYDWPLPVTLSSIATAVVHRTAITSLFLVKAGPTGVYGGFVSNPAASTWAYIQCFNAASIGAVILGTTVPQDVFHCPPNTAFGDKWSNSVPYDQGLVIAATTDLGNATIVSTAAKASLYIS